MTDAGVGESPKRRVSLTRLQRESEVGAELLSLCQTITSDGSLGDEEIHALKGWLVEHRGEDLPAVVYLVPLVERIIADGKVTSDERRELHVTIEAVLPPDIRGLSRAVRREREKTETKAAREQQRIQKERQREEQARNDPIEEFDFMVAGSRFEGRPAVIERDLRAPDAVVLAREPQNRHSRNAVAVLTKSGDQIGYVPEEDAADVAPLMDAGLPYRAWVKKILTGATHPIPVVIAEFYGKDSSVGDLAKPVTISTPPAPDRTQGSAVRGWLYIAVLVAVSYLALRSCF